MCGRFYLDLGDLWDLIGDIEESENRKEYSPGMDILYQDKNEEFKWDRWGIQVDFLNRPIINSRIEKLYESGFFLEDFEQRRILIPANSFFEWKKRGKTNTRYEIGLEDNPVSFLGGLYRLNEEGKREISILTMASFGDMEKIHHRMPILLKKDERKHFLEEEGKFLVRELLELKPNFHFTQKDPEQLGFL